IIVLMQIAEAPLFVIFDGPIWHAALALQTAVGLAIVAVKIPPGEGGHWWRLSWPAVICALIPAVWMIAQTIPTPFESGSNFISRSAAAALGTRMLGSISVDTGATVIALGRYLTAIAIAVLSAAVTINRQRAWVVLLALTATSTVLAICHIGLGMLE